MNYFLFTAKFYNRKKEKIMESKSTSVTAKEKQVYQNSSLEFIELGTYDVFTLSLNQDENKGYWDANKTLD